MKKVELEFLCSSRYSISSISVIRQTNAWSTLSHPNGRDFNGFLLMISGEAVFVCGSEEQKVCAGGLIYLPKGAKHSVYAIERSLNFYRINFNVHDAEDNEEIIFDTAPRLISESVPGRILDVCEELRKSTLVSDYGFKNLSLLCEILDYSQRITGKGICGRIEPAVEYINSHFTEEINIGELAKICYISEPHLFRLFKQHLGLSPIDYKNFLKLKKAEELLMDPECSISEIAAILGFENVCYFSRIFKKRRGMSPLQYRKFIFKKRNQYE